MRRVFRVIGTVAASLLALWAGDGSADQSTCAGALVDNNYLCIFNPSLSLKIPEIPTGCLSLDAPFGDSQPLRGTLVLGDGGILAAPLICACESKGQDPQPVSPRSFNCATGGDFGDEMLAFFMRGKVGKDGETIRQGQGFSFVDSPPVLRSFVYECSRVTSCGGPP